MSSDGPQMHACWQVDINEVNKLAHELKNRLERLQKMNEASLTRKVWCLLCLMLPA